MEKRPKVYDMSFASIYKMYLAKIERKNQRQSDLNKIIFWLTGYDQYKLSKQIEDMVSLEEFINQAPQINKNTHLIKGSICGYRVEDIEDPLMQKIRYLDKLVDELARGRSMDKILRS